MISESKTISKKKESIAGMFDAIASKYDFMNHFLSMGIDKYWRKKAIKTLRSTSIKSILDVATGTGDFAIALLKLNPEKIVGIDISTEMLKVGKQKIMDKKLEKQIELLEGDSLAIPFPDQSFDVVTVAFGVRNFENLQKGLNEINRVLKPEGRLLILEFSQPKNMIIKIMYNFYSMKIMPFFGSIFAGSRHAYTYLPISVETFPSGNKFLIHLNETNFINLKSQPLTFGIATIYSGQKRKT
jgi:demethylmenaquinone methyltransferase/2-methoxy-6-polyprenyl-1,4-benzoquinol methylase